MRRFEVHDADEEILAEGVQFSDQTAVIKDETGTVTALDGPALHGLDGHLVWLDQASEASYLHARLWAEKAEATIARVRHRHRAVEPDHPLGPRCAQCRTDHPCAELRALDQPEET